MKKSILLISMVVIFGGIILSSYEHGPAYEGGINRTGSQGSVANCNGSGCHGPNVSTTLVAITVTNSTGAVITEYTPGNTYDITIRGHNTASGVTTSEFGFQVSAVLQSDAQAGSFALSSGSNLRITTLAGLQIVEHKKPLHDSTDNYSVAHFTWTAPAAGSGTVKIYGILNAVGDGDDDNNDNNNNNDNNGNNNGNNNGEGEDGGYYPNTAPVITLTEHGGSSTAINSVANANAPVLFPNPCTNELNIFAKGAYTITIYTANGVPVYHSSINISGTGSFAISTYNMPAGTYMAEINDGIARITKTFVKL